MCRARQYVCALRTPYSRSAPLARVPGSVLDSGKAVAALLANGGAAIDYLEVIGAGKSLSKPSLPYIAVPTTAGTGAEVTKNAVLLSPEHNVKVSLRSDFMLPSVAVVDPLLTVTTPAAVTRRYATAEAWWCVFAWTSTRRTFPSDPMGCGRCSTLPAVGWTHSRSASSPSFRTWRPRSLMVRSCWQCGDGSCVAECHTTVTNTPAR